jgi:all-trans-retinol dehydrogenase (NAD+)
MDENIKNLFIEIVLWIWYVVESLGRAFYRNIFPSSWQSKEELQGKRALVTGSGGAIGRALALRLAEHGCNLILWDVIESSNAETARLCLKYGVDVRYECVDITNRKTIYEKANEIGPIDLLINNAGLLNPNGFLNTEDEKIDRLMEVNAKANFWTVKAFLPKMLEQKSGHLVAISSVAGLVGAPGLTDYTASKFALFGFMEALQHELAANGNTDIEFTTVCPIFVHTPMIDKLNIARQIPILETNYVADRVIEAIQLRQRCLMIPKRIYWLFALKAILPWNLYQSIIVNRRFKYM